MYVEIDPPINPETTNQQTYGKTNFKTEAKRDMADRSVSDPYLYRKL